MTNSEILSMQPGYDMDALVFEKLFGKKVLCWEPGWAPDGSWSINPGGEGFHVPHYVEHCCCDGKPNIQHCFDVDELRVVMQTGHALYCLERVPPLSTTWEDMRLVVEAMAARGYGMTMHAPDIYEGNWIVRFIPKAGDIEEAEAETAPHAVCIAAMLAREGEQCQ